MTHLIERDGYEKRVTEYREAYIYAEEIISLATLVFESSAGLEEGDISEDFLKGRGEALAVAVSGFWVSLAGDIESRNREAWSIISRKESRQWKDEYAEGLRKVSKHFRVETSSLIILLLALVKANK